MIKKCFRCGKEFRVRFYRKNVAKYCGNSCRAKVVAESNYKKNNNFGFKKGIVPWNKGLTKETNETLKKISAFYKNNKEIQLRKRQTGKYHFNWKGENRKKRQERHDSAYQYWHKQCKKRDEHRCRINNKDCFGYCVVHHILPWRDYPELRYNINNGITLCQAHHPRKRAEENVECITCGRMLID